MTDMPGESEKAIVQAIVRVLPIKEARIKYLTNSAALIPKMEKSLTLPTLRMKKTDDMDRAIIFSPIDDEKTSSDWEGLQPRLRLCEINAALILSI